MSEGKREIELEIGHVLFVDIVGYSKLLINEQSELLDHLKEMVRGSEHVRAADAAGKLIRLATGAGMALVFRNSPGAPARCALELSRADKHHPPLSGEIARNRKDSRRRPRPTRLGPSFGKSRGGQCAAHRHPRRRI